LSEDLAMIERLFPTVTLKIPFEQFRQLPRNSIYKYEYFNNTAYLSPRLRVFHGLLDLKPCPIPAVVDAQEPIVFRLLRPDDWPNIVQPFAAAFARVAPFCMLTDKDAERGAQDCLEYTHAGKDGPLIESACFVAVREATDQPCAAILITLIPPGDLTDYGVCVWREPPPPNAVEQRLGQPHLTWIFTSYFFAGYGIGSALLAAATQSLLTLGFTHLVSSFLAGNEYSVMWHWRNGFRLLSNPGSNRLMTERLGLTRRRVNSPAE